jgi:beta-galactosidase
MLFRTLLKLVVLCFVVSSCVDRTDSISANEDGNFNFNWEFMKDPADSLSAGLFKKADDKESLWENVNIPHTANIEPADSSEKQWQGIAWYRKFFTIPKEYKGKSVSLHFDGAMQVARIYLNGTLIQTHTGGYLPFTVKLDGNIIFGRQNCILVELDNRDNPLVPPGKPLAEMDFNYYSGIYRNVTLEIKDQLHISDPVLSERVAGGGVMVTFSNVSEQSAEINMQVDLLNESTLAAGASLEYSLIDPEGKSAFTGKTDERQVAPSSFCRFKEQIIAEQPRLWSPDSPELYSLKVRVIRNSEVIDSLTETIGIRTFSISSRGGFILNGKKIKLRGTNRHQEYPYIGNALSDNAQYRDAFIIKQSGFNFVRCSHYPQSPAFFDACDRLGILIMDPMPGWQFIGNEKFQDHSVTDMRQTVRRDRNHPSVILWEASLNETDMPKQFMERAHQAVHEELPGADVYTAGWVDDVYDVFIPARQHANPPAYWNSYSTNRPFIIIEYGDWEYYSLNAGFNQTAFAGLKEEERSSRQLRGFGQRRLAQQALNYQESHNSNQKGPAVGDANWLIFDYKRGYAPDIESSGILDIFRIPKFAYYFYKSQEEKGDPMIFIANYWNDPGFNAFKVYSNCEEVELSLNGKVFSRQKPDRDVNSTNLLHPPFSFNVPVFVPGELEAKGFIGGMEVIKDKRRTPGRAAKIELSVDLSGRELQAGKNDIVFVYASVVDEEGTVIPDADHPVRFTVEGGAELVGTNPRKAEAGIASILLRAGRSAGTVKITAGTEGLESGEMVVMMR